jgi:hypothetical protein
MAAFEPVYSEKELKGLTAKKRQALKKELKKQAKTHPQIKKILRQKTSTLYNKLKAGK